MKTTKPSVLVAALDKVLPGCEKVYAYEDGSKVTLTTTSITFDKLAILSKFFKTKKINVGSDSSGPGCETCGFGEENWVTIEILNPVLDF